MNFVRSHALIFLVTLILCVVSGFSQSSTIHSEYGPLSGSSRNQQRDCGSSAEDRYPASPRQRCVSAPISKRCNCGQCPAACTRHARTRPPLPLPHDASAATWIPLGPYAPGLGCERIRSAGLWLGCRARHRRRQSILPTARATLSTSAELIGGVWKSSNAGAAKRQSFKCYLDPDHGQSANTRHRIDRHSAATHQPRYWAIA